MTATVEIRVNLNEERARQLRQIAHIRGVTEQEVIVEALDLLLLREDAPGDWMVDAVENGSSTAMHSIMELHGLGREIWDGVDAQTYVNQMRDEWDKSR